MHVKDKVKKKSIKKSTKYTTHNIDEATYLIMKGLKYVIVVNDATSSTFTFTNESLTERYRREFWTRGAKVNIHSWLALRQGIKNELKGQSRIIINKRDSRKKFKKNSDVSIPVPFHPMTGESYWSVVNGIIVGNMFGSGEIHKLRDEANNCFRTKRDAEIQQSIELVSNLKR